MSTERDPDELMFLSIIDVIKKSQGATLSDYVTSAKSFIRKISASKDPNDQLVFQEILLQIDEKDWKESGDGSINILAEKLGVVLQLAENDIEAELNAWATLGEQTRKVKAIHNRKWQR